MREKEWRFRDVGGVGGEIYSPDGRSCWLQGDDYARFMDRMSSAATLEQEQEIMAEYDEVCES